MLYYIVFLSPQLYPTCNRRNMAMCIHEIKPDTAVVCCSTCTDLFADSTCTNLFTDSTCTNLFADSTCTNLFADSTCTDLFADSTCTDLFADSTCTDLRHTSNKETWSQTASMWHGISVESRTTRAPLCGASQEPTDNMPSTNSSTRVSSGYTLWEIAHFKLLHRNYGTHYPKICNKVGNLKT